MSKYRTDLPQLSGDLFLMDAGPETDLIFNKGIEIREFAAHTLLPDPRGREALTQYFQGFLSLAGEQDAGFVLDGPTWKAHPHWAGDLEATDAAPAYYMLNCAHPDHFFTRLDDSAWSRRVRGLRCNASRLSHAKLDECEVLDDGDPVELASQYKAIRSTMPWLQPGLQRASIHAKQAMCYHISESREGLERC